MCRNFKINRRKINEKKVSLFAIKIKNLQVFFFCLIRTQNTFLKIFVFVNFFTSIIVVFPLFFFALNFYACCFFLQKCPNYLNYFHELKQKITKQIKKKKKKKNLSEISAISSSFSSCCYFFRSRSLVFNLNYCCTPSFISN